MDALSQALSGFWYGFGWTFGVVAGIITLLALGGCLRPPRRPQKKG